MIDIGKPVPDFEAGATSQQTIRLCELAGRTVVLFFYPKDNNTPGCTREGQEFRDHHDAFQAAGAVVIGVSRDSLKSHERFRDKQQFPFELISDPDELLCHAFDVIKEKKLYGRTYMGIERSTFIIDNGMLRHAFRKVRVPGHVEAAVQAF